MIDTSYMNLIDKIYYEKTGMIYRVSQSVGIQTKEFRLTNISDEDGLFQILNMSGNTEYSLDGKTWIPYDFDNSPQIIVKKGTIIYLRGTQFNNNSSSRKIICFNKPYIIGGNIMSINNYNTMSTDSQIPESKFFSLFYQETNLIDAHKVNFGSVASIGGGGLSYCFSGCTSLTQGPNLSNIQEIASEGLMDCFSGCTSLTQGPDLSKVIRIETDGLRNCFHSCTSLTQGPDLSNIQEIASRGLMTCFFGCTSLTQGPDLSNVTNIGIEGLKNCFMNCTSLTQGPDLSNVTNIERWGLQNCFSNCSNVSLVTTPNIQDLTIQSILENWLNNAGTQVSETKIVRVPINATITYNSVSGIPTGWIREDYE